MKIFFSGCKAIEKLYWGKGKGRKREKSFEEKLKKISEIFVIGKEHTEP